MTVPGPSDPSDRFLKSLRHALENPTFAHSLYPPRTAEQQQHFANAWARDTTAWILERLKRRRPTPGVRKGIERLLTPEYFARPTAGHWVLRVAQVPSIALSFAQRREGSDANRFGIYLGMVAQHVLNGSGVGVEERLAVIQSVVHRETKSQRDNSRDSRALLALATKLQLSARCLQVIEIELDRVSRRHTPSSARHVLEQVLDRFGREYFDKHGRPRRKKRPNRKDAILKLVRVFEEPALLRDAWKTAPPQIKSVRRAARPLSHHDACALTAEIIKVVFREGTPQQYDADSVEEFTKYHQRKAQRVSGAK
jgi:hypothetical protein